MSDTTTNLPPRASHHVQRSALREAIAAWGVGRFALFGASEEGLIYPNGVDEVSGLVLNEQGRLWSFWTGWGDERQAVRIDSWDEGPITPVLTSGHEYQRARHELGLE